MKKKIIILGVAIIVVMTILMGITATILPLAEDGNVIREDLAVENDNYLDAHWDAIGEEINEHAVDINMLLNSAENLSEVTEQYCTGNGNCFTVTGVFNVLETNTESKAGYLTVQPEGYDGDYEIQIQIGTVFKGFAIRDSLTCIAFSDFDNQMDWSSLSNEIMQKIYNEKLSTFDMNALKGKKVQITGCFILNGSTLSIQPFDFSEA